MSIQQNVQQQNAATKATMSATASAFACQPESIPWLSAVLENHQLSSANGILVRLVEIPEQEGIIQAGVWLTADHEFFEFEAMITRDNQRLLGLEQFKNVTNTLSNSSHLLGVGVSFSALAIQLLNEHRG
jgi:hypothetical protein